MAEDKINYTKEAFLLPFNLVFLVATLLAAFFLIGTGIATALFVFAAAAELLYLGIMPRNERFQRAIKSREIAEHNKKPSEGEVLRLLHKNNQKRYVRYRNLEKQIRENYNKLSYASQGMLDGHLAKLDDLLDRYLELLSSKERYNRFTERTAEDELVRTIADLREEMKTDPPRVAAVKQRRLGILQKRLDKYKRAHENLEIIEAQIETIEDVTKYIYEQSLTMRNPEEVSFQLDTLMAEVEETQAAVEEIEEVFSGPSLNEADLAASDLLSGSDGYALDAPEELDPARERRRDPGA